jgi:hypothetical protein
MLIVCDTLAVVVSVLNDKDREMVRSPCGSTELHPVARDNSEARTRVNAKRHFDSQRLCMVASPGRMKSE